MKTITKQKTIVTLVLAIVLLAATTAIAAGHWTGWGTVTGVYSGYTSGAVFVKGLSNKAGCSSALISFTRETSDPEGIRALATAALLSGKPLSCNVNGCSGKYQKGFQCLLGNEF